METRGVRQALLDVESFMSEFSVEIEKMAWCREILEDAVNAGGRDGERYGENTTEMGLAYIMTDVETGFQKLKAGVYQLLEETENQESAEA